MAVNFPISFLTDSQLAPRTETIKSVIRGNLVQEIASQGTGYIDPGSGSALAPTTDHAWIGYNRWCFSGTIEQDSVFESGFTAMDVIIEIETSGTIVAGPAAQGEWVEIDRWPLGYGGLIRFEDYRVYAPIVRWSVYNPGDASWVIAEIKAEAR